MTRQRGGARAFESLRRAHLEHLSRCWRDSVRIAEKGVARRSSDPADEDARRSHVFDLALAFLYKHALDMGDFAELGEILGEKGGRIGARRPREFEPPKVPGQTRRRRGNRA